jgi:polar amino acid transport system substrate-binding protein
MRWLSVSILVAIVATISTSEAQSGLAPTGILRAVCLSNNPAQARRDPATGALRGVAVDLTRELGRRLGVETTLTALGSPQAVIDAVRNGQADIGFVAYNPERAGPVEFSQTYMLVQQTFLVRQDSPIRSVADIDRPNQNIGAGKGDSIALYLARTLKQAQLVEVTDSGAAAGVDALTAGKLDAFGANRQRLTDAMRDRTGLRLLPDDLYGVEQALIVPKGSPETLQAVNQFLDDVRRSGFLRSAIEQSGIIGIAVAEPAAR